MEMVYQKIFYLNMRAICVDFMYNNNRFNLPVTCRMICSV